MADTYPVLDPDYSFEDLVERIQVEAENYGEPISLEENPKIFFQILFESLSTSEDTEDSRFTLQQLYDGYEIFKNRDKKLELAIKSNEALEFIRQLKLNETTMLAMWNMLDGKQNKQIVMEICKMMNSKLKISLEDIEQCFNILYDAQKRDLANFLNGDNTWY